MLDLLSELGLDLVALFLQFLRLFNLRGLNAAQLFIHKVLIVSLKCRNVKSMFGLQLCKLPLALDLC